MNLYKELYSKYVQMDDRMESVHIWNEELALKNAGKWQPIEISEEQYLKEMEYSWNKIKDNTTTNSEKIKEMIQERLKGCEISFTGRIIGDVNVDDILFLMEEYSKLKNK